MDKIKAIAVIEDFIRFWEDESQVIHFRIKDELDAFRMAVKALEKMDDKKGKV